MPPHVMAAMVFIKETTEDRKKKTKEQERCTLRRYNRKERKEQKYEKYTCR
jgi:hypothetical protein